MDFLKQFPQVWQKEWEQNNYGEATPIQKQSFRFLHEGQSMIGVSPTGSGKTLAYLLPLLLNVEKDQPSQLLILLPSQELAMQVFHVTNQWGQLLGLKTQSLIGGANVKRQVEKLKQKPEILIATPGRLLELIKSKKVKAHLFQMVVFDEIDHFLQKNSDQSIFEELIKTFPKEIQVVCFSATAHEKQKEMEDYFQRKFVIVDVRSEDQTTAHLFHSYIQVSKRKRTDLLRKLAYIPGFRAIVFLNHVDELGAVSEKLTYEKITHATLASDQSKEERKQSIQRFTKKEVTFLLTTDVGARGLDFPDLTIVVQYDPTFSKDRYTHRSGRVGRMGKEGFVFTMIDERQLLDLKKMAADLHLPIEESFVYEGRLWSDPPVKKKEDKKNQSVKKKKRKKK